jgi:hypothetical protein
VKPNFPRFDPTRVGDTLASLKNGLVQPFQAVHDFVRQHLNNGLTLTDNMRAAIVTFPLVHGVEYVFDAPKTLLSRPQWARPLGSELASGSPSAPLVALVLNKTRSDRRLGLTAYYDSRDVGEYTSATLARASATALTTEQAKTVASIALSAGDWDVTGVVGFVGTPTGSRIIAAIGTADGNDMAGTVQGDSRVDFPAVSTGGSDASLVVPSVRVSITSASTRYLKAIASFSAGSISAFGRISARRAKPSYDTTGYTAYVTAVLWGG